MIILNNCLVRIPEETNQQPEGEEEEEQGWEGGGGGGERDGQRWGGEKK